MSSVPERGEIDEEYKWDLGDLYADVDAWEADFEHVQSLIEDVRAYEGRTTESAATLQEVLETREELLRTVADVYSFASMRADEDTRDQEAQALQTRARSLYSEARSAVSFVEPELQSAGPGAVDGMVAEASALETYDHYFDDVLRMKPHTRSAEVEALIADLSEVLGAGEAYDMLTNADMEFPAVEDSEGEQRRITLSNFTILQKESDREFRREVYEAFYDEWEGVRNSIAATLRNSVKADVKLARARDYDSAREAALDDPNVPVAVYDNLVGTVRENLDALSEHVTLKRAALNVDELRMWDLYAPLVDADPEVEYETAREHVIEAVAPLGEDYQSRLAEGLESRWVDVYENAGKQSGAYSGGTYDSQPYILMNYQDDIASMYTLAHELGHSMHSELASDHQPYVYADYEIFVAEVASTVNETLLTYHLLETVGDEQFRRQVLDEYLERIRSTLFRQTMFAEFEQEAHAVAADGGALTADRFDELYGDLKRAYYGSAAVDDRIEREWMRIPHFYRGFYVYQYATGISAAVALADRIRQRGPSAADDYLEFLRTGSRAYPLELLRGAGVDMADPEPVEAAIDAYAGFVEEFRRLL